MTPHPVGTLVRLAVVGINVWDDERFRDVAGVIVGHVSEADCLVRWPDRTCWWYAWDDIEPVDEFADWVKEVRATI